MGDERSPGAPAAEAPFHAVAWAVTAVAVDVTVAEPVGPVQGGGETEAHVEAPAYVGGETEAMQVARMLEESNRITRIATDYVRDEAGSGEEPVWLDSGDVPGGRRLAFSMSSSDFEAVNPGAAPSINHVDEEGVGNLE